MIGSIDHYENVISVQMKPSRAFPEGGCFYTDAAAEDLVRGTNWYFANVSSGHDGSIYVMGRRSGSPVLFHCEYMHLITGGSYDCIDHVNGVTTDCTERNLKGVSSQWNSRNRPLMGYSYRPSQKNFLVQITLNRARVYNKCFKTEIDTLDAVRTLRAEYFSDYDYDFLLDRRGDRDILDLERTGQISADEATLRHVMRYAKDNAWYVYRYGLEDYFTSHNIMIPEYSIDDDGFMCDKVTGKHLCPKKL